MTDFSVENLKRDEYLNDTFSAYYTNKKYFFGNKKLGFNENVITPVIFRADFLKTCLKDKRSARKRGVKKMYDFLPSQNPFLF